MADARYFWDELFGPGEGNEGGVQVAMRLLRKRGQPFLLLPTQARAAATALELYAAQTLRARLAKAALRGLFRAGWPAGAESLTFTLAGQAPFTRFVSARTGAQPAAVPCFAVLAGNPAMASQRFLVLAFEANQRPVAVVKAGLTPSARALVQREGAFLASASAKVAGIPHLQDHFESARASAFGLDYYPGRSPRPGEEGALPALLGGWVDAQHTTPVAKLPDWIRLEQAGAKNASFVPVAQALRPREVHPTIYHGDFAPWNIKVSAQGNWTVLDWERGELAGLPGWDWFHYTLQTGLLVERLATLPLIQRIGHLLDSEAFRTYARQAGVAGLERPLVLAYLVHCVEVLKPAEGLAATQELLTALGARWPKQTQA